MQDGCEGRPRRGTGHGPEAGMSSEQQVRTTGVESAGGRGSHGSLWFFLRRSQGPRQGEEGGCDVGLRVHLGCCAGLDGHVRGEQEGQV